MKKKFKFTFFDGQVFGGYGTTEADAIKDLGLEAYNPVAYTVEEIKDELVPVEILITDRAASK